MYPFSKFITFDELKGICKKYKLVYTEVARYLKDIPEKNLIEIENRQPILFRNIFEIENRQPMQEQHVAENEFYARVAYYVNYSSGFSLPIGSSDKFQKLKNFTKQDIGDQRKLGSKADLSKFGFQYDKHNIYSYEFKEHSKQGLFICAPADHFDLKGLKSDGEFGYATSTTVQIVDPVVFEFFKGDVCRVISKWGLEGDDYTLVNPVNN